MAFPSSSTPRCALSVGTVAVVLALAFSGCSGDAEDGDVVGAGSTSTSQSVESAAPSATEAEDYVPATKAHPAQNVPQPSMPAEARKETDAGARAFMKYWVDSMNYFLQTGDSQYVDPLVSSDNDQYTEVLNNYKKSYEEGKWSYGTVLEITPEDSDMVQFADGDWSLIVKNNRSEGGIASKSGSVTKVEGRDFNNQPLGAILSYENGSWEFKGLQAMQDVDYGDK